jgi:predicted nucleotidyltransferase
MGLRAVAYAGEEMPVVEAARFIDPSASLLAAFAYADLFDFPLSLEELARYQVGTRMSSEQIARYLETDPLLREGTSHSDGYYTLRGRESNFQARKQRRPASERLWPRARAYGRWLSRLPYVRMVAVTGSLAVDNVALRPDIDLMVVAEPGRVWICRRMLVAAVRLARLLGDEICPNYVISADRLLLDQQDFFTAHELAQMVPLHGADVYRDMLLANDWALDYLPAGFALVAANQTQRPYTAIEKLLKRPRFNAWEAWEMKRLRAKLSPALGLAAEVVCSPDQCKGHTSLHRQTTLARYKARLTELGLADTFFPMLH